MSTIPCADGALSPGQQFYAVNPEETALCHYVCEQVLPSAEPPSVLTVLPDGSGRTFPSYRCYLTRAYAATMERQRYQGFLVAFEDRISDFRSVLASLEAV